MSNTRYGELGLFRFSSASRLYSHHNNYTTDAVVFDLLVTRAMGVSILCFREDPSVPLFATVCRLTLAHNSTHPTCISRKGELVYNF